MFASLLTGAMAKIMGIAAIVAIGATLYGVGVHLIDAHDAALTAKGIAEQQVSQTAQAAQDATLAASQAQKQAQDSIRALGAAQAAATKAMAAYTAFQLEIAHAPSSDDGPLSALALRGLGELRDGRAAPPQPGGDHQDPMGSNPAGAGHVTAPTPAGG